MLSIFVRILLYMIENGKTRANEIRSLFVLPELVSHHLDKRPNIPAVTEYDAAQQRWVTLTFKELYDRSVMWAKAFTAANLKKGDRVAMLLPNSIEAVCFDQGALLIGLVPVPLHIIDTPDNCAYILQDSGTKVLVTLNHARWHAIEKAAGPNGLPDLQTVVFINDEDEDNGKVKGISLQNWLSSGKEISELPPLPKQEDLACLVYTSGTTGKPKGVMLTHENIMSDISSLLYNIAPEPTDSWLSFLPLSHTFERTTTYYIGLGMGNQVTFSRGITRLVDDLKTVKPSILMSVPRIYEKVNAKIQERLKTKSLLARKFFTGAIESGWRKFCKENGLEGEEPRFTDKILEPLYERFVRQNIKNQFGGRVRVAVSGGAAISPEVIKTFIGLGVPIYQGYGMTETSPIISVNKIGNNDPLTVGQILPGIQAKLGDKDELLVRGPQIMRGYWNRKEDTAKAITEDGWLSTGDQADILPNRYLRIKGRIKKIIVTSNGEKVPPVDIEQLIETDPLFAQVMLIGDNRPFISALVVLNKDEWKRLAVTLELDPNSPDSLSKKAVQQALLRRMKAAAKGAPQYGIPRAVTVTLDPWTIENGALTPTLKIKRRILNQKFEKEIESMYTDFGKNKDN